MIRDLRGRNPPEWTHIPPEARVARVLGIKGARIYNGVLDNLPWEVERGGEKGRSGWSELVSEIIP
ncbi:MAG: hypothetical protein LBS37_05345 [Treponema sp.]|nr:hypothetical protein [Treponema sp.]